MHRAAQASPRGHRYRVQGQAQVRPHRATPTRVNSPLLYACMHASMYVYPLITTCWAQPWAGPNQKPNPNAHPNSNPKPDPNAHPNSNPNAHPKANPKPNPSSQPVVPSRGRTSRATWPSMTSWWKEALL